MDNRLRVAEESWATLGAGELARALTYLGKFLRNGARSHGYKYILRLMHACGQSKARDLQY